MQHKIERAKHRQPLLAALLAAILLAATLGVALTACGGEPVSAAPATAESAAIDGGQIYLYGETHAQQSMLDRELALWQDYYAQGLQDLFIEMPNYTAALLNRWMQAEDDTLLDTIYDAWKNTASHNPIVREWYLAVKESCPETVFHGYDVGHQADSLGKLYLETLAAEGKQDSAEYTAAQAVAEQGVAYYEDIGSDEAEIFRENAMADNFVREYDSLSGRSVMVICGSYHAGTGALEEDADTLRFAGQLQQTYGAALHIVDLTPAATATSAPATIGFTPEE